MCQCICCDCWWCNYCGILCGGWHNAFCLCSIWCCKPLDLMNIDPHCIHLCKCDGWGQNFFCWGNVCCAPETVKAWSKMRSGGGDSYGTPRAVILINNQTN
jgi:hypothetical protein